MTTPDRDAILAADASTDPRTLADLANDRADLRPVVAANPNCPLETLQWLRTLPDPAIAAGLARNRVAIGYGLVAAAPVSPWAAPPPDAAPAAGPSGTATTPPTAPIPAVPPTVPTPVAAVPPTEVPATEVLPTVPAGAVPPPGAVPPTVPSVNVPPTEVLPTVPAGAVPLSAADPTPTAIPRPPTDVRTEERRRGGFGLVLVMIPLLFVGGCLAALALARGGDEANDGALPATTTVVTDVLPTQPTAPSVPTTAAPPPIDTTVPPTEAATAPPPPPPTEPAPTEPPTAAPPAPAPTVRAAATTVRPPATTARPVATTARAAATTTRATAAAAASPTTIVRAAAGVTSTTAAASSTSAAYAYTLAQQFASALASGDWARARVLSPSSSTTDANYQAQYGNLDASTVVPVRATAASVTTFSLRIGLVANETNNGVKQTSLFCARWDVNTSAGTVTRVDGTKLRTENGTKAASAYTAELTKTCASVALD